MDNVPKVLVIALAELFEQQKLIQWNMYSNGGNVNVSLKFSMADIAQSSMSYPMRNKSPSQISRDNERSMSWHESTPMGNSSTRQSFYGSYLPTVSEDSHVQDRHLPSQNDLSAHVPPYSPVMPSNQGQITEVETSEMCDPDESVPIKGESDNSKQNLDIDVQCQSKQTTDTYPSDDFTKIVLDHRNVLDHHTIRGITKDKKIVSYELGKETDFFKVLERSEDNMWSYDGLTLWINGFNELRTQSGSLWSHEIQQLLKHWHNYKKQEGIS